MPLRLILSGLYDFSGVDVDLVSAIIFPIGPAVQHDDQGDRRFERFHRGREERGERKGQPKLSSQYHPRYHRPQQPRSVFSHCLRLCSARIKTAPCLI